MARLTMGDPFVPDFLKPDIRQLVKEEVLFDLQNDFSRLLGLNVAFVDLKYEIVGGSRRFAEKTADEKTTCQMLAEALGERLCKQSDQEAGEIAKRERKAICYRCRFYCSNFVIPIMVMNEVVGFIYSGQFFVHVPSDEMKNALEKNDPRANVLIKERFAEAGAVYWNDDGPHTIRKHFFTDIDYPTDNELMQAAEDAVVAEKENFVRLFKEQSKSNAMGKPGNRVKDFGAILNAIRTLSSVAKAVGEECAQEYELKRRNDIETYAFRTCNQIYLDVAQTHFLKQDRQREIDRHLTELESAIKVIHGENATARGSEAIIDRVHMLEKKGLVIYEMLLEQEVELTERDLKWDQWFFYIPPPKDLEERKEELKEARLLIRDARRAEGDSAGKSTKIAGTQMDDLREKIENLKRALDNIRESKRQLQKVRGRNIKMRIWQSLLRGRITRIAASIFFVLGAIGAIGPIIELLKLVGWLK